MQSTSPSHPRGIQTCRSPPGFATRGGAMLRGLPSFCANVAGEPSFLHTRFEILDGFLPFVEFGFRVLPQLAQLGILGKNSSERVTRVLPYRFAGFRWQLPG